MKRSVSKVLRFWSAVKSVWIRLRTPVTASASATTSAITSATSMNAFRYKPEAGYCQRNSAYGNNCLLPPIHIFKSFLALRENRTHPSNCTVLERQTYLIIFLFVVFMSPVSIPFARTVARGRCPTGYENVAICIHSRSGSSVTPASSSFIPKLPEAIIDPGSTLLVRVQARIARRHFL